MLLLAKGQSNSVTPAFIIKVGKKLIQAGAPTVQGLLFQKKTGPFATFFGFALLFVHQLCSFSPFRRKG